MSIVSKNTNEGIEIDLGLKDFAICSNGEKYKNINKTEKIRKIEKKLKREQKKLSRKYENLKKKGGTVTKSNINKQKVKVQKFHHKLENIRTDYVNKTISNIINQEPKFITIEDLNLKDRIYKYKCGYIEDRDLNASLNLRDAKIYKIA